ncbi:MAG: type I-B CRISPR-associated protein Cas7/Cst2/DevR, partial [Chloroflexi bacterium]|nr:type I-B CRISPR-associated protein Cas7/Cst2/DevR [Chloroflexota bacterium]
MAFLTGVLFIDAPASALNNAGMDAGARTDNATAVKTVRTREGVFPYVSAQAFRYWLRTTLEKEIAGWRSAPIRREGKVAYTDGDPIEWWDDDLFGYMRAPSKKKNRGEDSEDSLSVATAEITRVSPFRVSTLVSVAPVVPTQDFGTMSRHEGDPVPHEHQFYRTIFKGMFSLDLGRVGTFTYIKRSGFLNLDEVRVEKARERGLEHLEEEKAYRLPLQERIQRVTALLEGLGRLSGGAKQAIHYTDVAPVVLIGAVIQGANNPLNYL